MQERLPQQKQLNLRRRNSWASSYHEEAPQSVQRVTCALVDHVTSLEKYCSSMAAMHTAKSNTAAAENHIELMLMVTVTLSFTHRIGKALRYALSKR